MNLKHSPATERNKDPILECLKLYLQAKGRLLEVGSGYGEHAIYFGKHFKHVEWVTSEIKSKHKVIQSRLKEAKLPNVHGPVSLMIGQDDFPKQAFNYVFSANTLHIMSWKEAKTFFKLLGKRLREGSLVFFYGPFNYDGQYTSQSNETFDHELKERNKSSGIRNFEDVALQMKKTGFKLIRDHEMPANNRFLAFERLAFVSK